MEFEFDSLKNFHYSLEQVELLIQSAEENKDDETKYPTFTKAALLLLTAKFENFIEQIVEEYIGHINGLQLIPENIPACLKISHSLYMLKTAMDKNCNLLSSKDTERKITFFDRLGELWIGDAAFTNLEIDNKFSYGKHGSEELRKIFKNIGVDDIFSEVKIYKQTETLLGVVREQIDFRAKFNAMVSIRNNIIHEDATPNLTPLDIKDNYKKTSTLFADELSIFLNNNLVNIKGTV